MPDKLPQVGPIQASSLFPFACKGCGELCCGNIITPIYVSPPEYARIRWYLDRNPDLKRQFDIDDCLELDRTHPKGIPILKYNFLVPQVCQFIRLPAERGAFQALCAIHPVRPLDCRLFPLVMENSWSDIAQNFVTDYAITSICPGFTLPQPGEALYPGYAPFEPGLTVEPWLDGQFGSDLLDEYIYYHFGVANEKITRGEHLPTAQNPAGKLTAAGYDELAQLLYNVPPVPPDPAQDHNVIMQWLSHFLELPSDSAA